MQSCFNPLQEGTTAQSVSNLACTNILEANGDAVVSVLQGDAFGNSTLKKLAETNAGEIKKGMDAIPEEQSSDSSGDESTAAPSTVARVCR